ncbi:MAG: GntR family transcriptional regulator [Magnetospirillum sp.]|nr:GntR family transcriptional regulator [Magnetospirillum sp.]
MASKTSRSDTQKTTQAQRVRGWLIRRIVDGELPAGTKLTEMEIAAALGCSRTPVREAYGQLVAMGLARSVGAHRSIEVVAGAVTAPLDLAECLMELDAVCARLAARRMGPVERQAMATLAVAEVRQAMRAGSGNRALADLVLGIEQRLAALVRPVDRGASPSARDEADRAARDEADRALRAALAAGDPMAAEAAVRR